MNIFSKNITKKLLKGLLFTAILIALNTFFSNLFNKHIASIHNLEINTIRNLKGVKKNTTDILVLGDSHPGTSINPNHFKYKLVSWCSGGERYSFNYFKLKYFFSTYNPPKILILPLDLHSFKSAPTDGLAGGDDFFWFQYMDYYEVGKLVHEPFLYLLKYLKGRYAPYVGEAKVFYHWLTRNHPLIAGLFLKDNISPSLTQNPDKHPGKPKHAAPPLAAASPQKPPIPPTKKPKPIPPPPMTISPAEKEKKENFLKTDSHSRVYQQFRKEIQIIAPINVHYFKKILQLCLDHNVKVILVKFPVAYYYRNEVKNFFKIRPYYRRIHSLIKPFNQLKPGSIYIIDCQSLFFNHPEMLANSDHVNMNGARTVSRKLSKFINTLISSPSPHHAPSSDTSLIFFEKIMIKTFKMFSYL